jgi:hypothetical protein
MRAKAASQNSIGATHLSNRCHPPIGKAGLGVWLAFGRQQETGVRFTHLSNQIPPLFGGDVLARDCQTQQFL